MTRIKSGMIFVFFLFIYKTAFCQDLIMLKSGEEITVKVTEINFDNVKYKEFSNLDGPIYTVTKDKIFMIKYKNGKKEVFNNTEATASAPTNSVQSATKAVESPKRVTENTSTIKNQAAATMPATTSQEKFKYFTGDFGLSYVSESGGGSTTTLSGLGWALGFNMAKMMKSSNEKSQKFASIGAEIRNYNATSSADDGAGGTIYTNLHYYYLGLVGGYNIINNTVVIDKDRKMSLFYNGTITLGFKVKANVVESSTAGGTHSDDMKDVSSIMAQIGFNVGITYKTPKRTYTVGPYWTYVLNNMYSGSGDGSVHAYSYGIRLGVLPFK